MALVFNPRTGLYEERLNANPPKIKSFCKIGDDSILSGTEYILKWDIEDYEKIHIDGIDCTNLSDYKFTAFNSGNITHTIIATNEFGRSSLALELTVLDCPQIEFTSSKNILKSVSDDTVELRWRIQHAQTIEIHYDNKIEQIDDTGGMTVCPTENTTYTICVKALDGKSVVEVSQRIELHKPSTVSFEIDKPFTLPGVPVVVSWNVENAKKVELQGEGEVEFSSSRVLQFERETTVKLIVEDTFGVMEYEKTVYMLPIPQIRALLVPTPTFIQNVKLQINQPRLALKLKFPKLEFRIKDIDIPEQHSMRTVCLVENSFPKRVNNVLETVKQIFKSISKWNR